MKRCATNRNLPKWIFLGLITLTIYNIVVLTRLGHDLDRIREKQNVEGKRLMNYFGALVLGIITLGIVPFVWEIKAICRTYHYANNAQVETRGSAVKVILFQLLLGWTIICTLIAWSNWFKTANSVCRWYNGQLDNQLDNLLAPAEGDVLIEEKDEPKGIPELEKEEEQEEAQPEPVLVEQPKEEPVKQAAPVQEEAKEEPVKEEKVAEPVKKEPAKKPVPAKKAEPANKPAPKKEVAPVKKETTAKAEPKKAEEKPMAKPAPKKAAEPKDSKRVYHVAKREDGMWAVKFAGGEKAIKLFKTKVEAEAYTKQMAENQGGVMLVHNSKGANKGKIAKK